MCVPSVFDWSTYDCIQTEKRDVCKTKETSQAKHVTPVFLIEHTNWRWLVTLSPVTSQLDIQWLSQSQTTFKYKFVFISSTVYVTSCSNDFRHIPIKILFQLKNIFIFAWPTFYCIQTEELRSTCSGMYSKQVKQNIWLNAPTDHDSSLPRPL